MPEIVILDNLKRLILIKTGIKIISPSDCKFISISIQKELHKSISETTIKRLFGFAEIKNQFSKYTINTLLEFVEKADSYDAIDHHQTSTLEATENLELTRAKAFEITLYTLKYIRNRSSVPYDMTIGRKFAKYDFEYFYSSDKSFTSFISQPGYGKSILLSHLVQELALDDHAKYKNDIFLFLNATDIFEKLYESYSIEDRIKAKLGLNPDTKLTNYFDEQYERFGIKFIIIIDGFPELVVNKISKPRIFDKIINLISSIDESENIKLILSMRSTMWNRFYERFKYVHFLKQKWFAGSYFNLNDNSNVPPLTEQEIDDIFQRMCPQDFKTINKNVKSQLKFPFHIQWYYQLKEEYPEFNSYTNIIFFEIIDRFIQEKIYQSNYATEKILYCKKIIQLTNFGRNNSTVLKSDLIKELSVFNNAYMELLADGILMEEKINQNSFALEFVRFIQPHVFEYFLFIELLDVFDQQMDEHFFDNLNNDYFGNQVRFQLLQWSIRYIIRCEQFEHLSSILNLKLNNYEKNYLIYFIAENLNYKLKDDADLINKLKVNRIHETLSRHLIHFDFIDSCYKEAINSLILVVDTDQNLLFYHSILSIFDALSLDPEQISKRIAQMEKLAGEAEKWVVDPYETLKLIYLKVKGISIKEHNTLLKIEEFKNNEQILNTDGRELPGAKQVLVFLIMITVNLFYGTPLESIKIINSMIRLYPKLFVARKPFAVYLLNLLAVAKAKTVPDEKTNQMERILTTLYKNNAVVNPTLYAQTVFLSLKAQQSKNRREYTAALHYAEDCLKIYQRNKLVVNEIAMYNLIINIYQETDEHEKANEYIYKKISLLDDKGINPAPFHSVSNNN
jgi:hypothetical protein